MIDLKIINWKKYSWLIDSDYPKHNSVKYNWEEHSHYVAKPCRIMIDLQNINWKTQSRIIAEKYPELFDADKYNWKDYSWAVAQHCPHLIDWNRINRRQYAEWKKKQMTKI